MYFYIGRHEVGHTRRYDGQTLFGNTIDRDFLTLEPVTEMPIIEQYVHYVYLSACTMGAVMYGDLIPLTISEQMFTFGAMFVARIFLAFLYAEAAAYLSSVHSAYSNHVRVRTTVIKYLELHNLPIQMKRRVYKYHEILWNNFKGINMNEILNNLPSSIQKQIKFSLFSDLIKNVTLFPKDDKAAISALISRLNLQLISEGEYVIRDGEIADSMYFILRGSVNVIKNKVILATLEQGANFGEMALAARRPTIRTASALCITHVSVGSLSITNFNIICASYPIFESKIQEEVQKRQKDLEEKTKNAVQDHEMLKQFTLSKNLSIIKEDNASESRHGGSNKTPKKGSRVGSYKIEEPECEDNPSMVKLSNNNLLPGNLPIIKDKTKGRYSQIIKPDDNKLNNSNINIEINDDSKDQILVQGVRRPNEQDDVKINQDEDEESESFEIPSSKSSPVNGPKKLNKTDKNNDSKPLNAGVAAIKPSRTRCAWIFPLMKHFTFIRTFQAFLLMLTLYNIVFIPLQAAYQIDYNPGYIVMEVFTLIFYAIDWLMIVMKYKQTSKVLREMQTGNNKDDKKLWRSIDDEK